MTFQSSTLLGRWERTSDRLTWRNLGNEDFGMEEQVAYRNRPIFTV